MKIKHPLVKGKVVQLKPQIFCALIDDNYDRTMLFCRYQEFYETPYKQFRNKFFTWEEYMRYYKNKWKKNLFTYPIDWSGFNIPSNIIEKGLNLFSKDKGPYDEIMNNIWYYCENHPLRYNKPRTKWYLIGASSKDVKTINHELAHGYYYTNSNYKKNVDNLLLSIPVKIREKIFKKLMKMGYINDTKILMDEAQAFLSTGLYNGLDTLEIKKYEKEFINNFKKYNK